MAQASQAAHRSCGRSRVSRAASELRTAYLVPLLLVTLPLSGTAAELVDVRSARHPDFTRIVFETDEKVSYAIENRSLGKERMIELSLPATARETILRAVHEPAVSVQIETAEAGSRALVKVSGPVDVWTNQLGNPPRVVLDLRVAEPAADLDPEQLDALDYQIVVEADPAAPRASPAAPPAATRPAASAPSEPPRDQPTGWARSPRLWWMLVAIAVAFLGVLWIQRLTLRRRQRDRVAPPPPAPPATPAPPAARPPSTPSPERAPSPKAAAPPPRPSPPPAVPPPAVAEAPPEPPKSAETEPSRDLFALLSRMEERLAVLEREVRETRVEGRELRERSLAHAEELRAHRVAVSRILRRPVRGRSAGSTGSTRPPGDVAGPAGSESSSSS